MAIKGLCYSETSSLYILRYIFNKKKTYLERGIWLVLLLMSTIFVSLVISSDWTRMKNGPVNVIIEDPLIELYKIDFPAVTVCSDSKIRMEKLDKFIARQFGSSLNKTTLRSIRHSIYTLSHPRHMKYGEAEQNLWQQYPPKYLIKNQDIPSIMLQITPSVDDVIQKCYWRGNFYNCSDLFRRQHTEQGICYSFNSKTAIRENNSSPITPPYMNEDGSLTALRLNSVGKITGLELFFQTPQNNFKSMKKQGYSITIHHPSDYPPAVKDFEVSESKNDVYRFEISVEKTDADLSLYVMDEDARGCHLARTGHLNSEENCYQRCQLQHTNDMCNCTPFYFPQLKGGAVICGIQHLKCLIKIRTQLKALEVTKKMPGFPEWSNPPTISCSCLPSCSDTSYITKLRRDRRENSIFEVTFAYVDIFYKDKYAIGYTRQAKLTIHEFLVGIGGSGGLCLGCSVISIVEIVYLVFQFMYHKFFSKLSNEKKKKMTKVFPYVN